MKEVLRDYHFEDNSCRECAMKKMAVLSREKLVQYLLRKVVASGEHHPVGLPNGYGHSRFEGPSRF